jgi:hypothetical protein
MICAPGIVSGGTVGIRYRFQVLCSRTHFRRYRGRRGSFSCFALPDSFHAVPRVSGPRFHVLLALTSFRRYHGRRVPFSCFVLPDSFSAVPRASGPIFMFFAPGIIFSVTEGVGSRFHVLRSRTHFRRYRGRRFRFHVL